MPFAQRGQRGARRAFAFVERALAQFERSPQRLPAGRQVQRHADHAALARRERLVEVAHVRLRADGDQERRVVCRESLADDGRRQRQRRPAARQEVHPAAEHRASRRKAIQLRQRVAARLLQLLQQQHLAARLRDVLEFGHRRIGVARPRAQVLDRLLRHLGQRLLRIRRPQMGLRPPRRVPPRQGFVFVQHLSQVRQREPRFGAAVGLQLHRARLREAVERRAEFLARGEQLEPVRDLRPQAHAASSI